ncbi:MAG: metallophosphoesterase [Phenylobacterium sp.]|uniref:metallophosphoesterase family protein n=1 Tax=Phenylobacterium sp. TaxID=1871053 RepID=UPI002A43D9D7|nr:metallophosphoesterase [Phenylobacterium sp.]
MLQTIRLAHLSDIHFGYENAPAVAAARAWLCEQAVDLTIVSGDVTRWGETSEFAAAAAWLDTLPGPKLVTPGNHDAPYLAFGERLFAPFARFEQMIGPSRGQTFLTEHLAVRGVNTARGVQPRMNWSKGQISRRQVAETTAWLVGLRDEALRVVVLHHPLVEMLGGPMTGKVWGGAAAAEALAHAGADLVLSGHIHAPFALPYGYGDGRTYAVGAGTLSVRERGVAAGFNSIEVEAHEVRVTALAWTGSHFEPTRTWALDRRRRGTEPAPGAAARTAPA